MLDSGGSESSQRTTSLSTPRTATRFGDGQVDPAAGVEHLEPADVVAGQDADRVG